MRWLGGIPDAMEMNLGKLREMVRDREAWRAAVPGGGKESDMTRQLNSNDNNSDTENPGQGRLEGVPEATKQSGWQTGRAEGAFKKNLLGLPGHPVAKMPSSNTGDAGSISGLGTKIPHAAVKTGPSHK